MSLPTDVPAWTMVQLQPELPRPPANGPIEEAQEYKAVSVPAEVYRCCLSLFVLNKIYTILLQLHSRCIYAGPAESVHRSASSSCPLFRLHLAEPTGSQEKVLQGQRSSHDSRGGEALQGRVGCRASRGEEKVGLAAACQTEEGHSSRAQRPVCQGPHWRDAGLLCALHTGSEREDATDRLSPSGRQGVAAGPGHGHTVPRLPARVHRRGEAGQGCRVSQPWALCAATPHPSSGEGAGSVPLQLCLSSR